MCCEIQEEEYQSTLRVTRQPHYNWPQTTPAHSGYKAHRTQLTQITRTEETLRSEDQRRKTNFQVYHARQLVMR